MKESELQRRIDQDAAALLYGNSIAGLAISAISSIMIVFAFNNPELKQIQQTWLLAMILILSFRAMDALRWFIRLSETDFDGKSAIFRYGFGVYMTAIMWSVYTLTTFQKASIFELTFNIIVVSAMAGGGAAVLAAHRYAGAVYVTILLFPTSIALLFSDQTYHFTIGILGLLFCFTIGSTSLKSAKFTLSALKLKNENEVLVHHMEERIEKRARKIYELSHLDPLTGLLNRNAFLAELGKSLQEVKKNQHHLALLFIDLDGFKKINDALGHDMGDKVLSRTAKRLKELSGSQENLCRWGGDEFILALPKSNVQKAMGRAAEIIQMLSLQHKFNGNRLSVSATVGISMYPEHAEEPDTLIRLADTAMYHQKKQFPSRAFVFSSRLSQQILREHSLKQGLSKAIQKQELRLVFQPLVTCHKSETLGFEALLRWRHQRENISPVEFIPIAEQYGMVCDIGNWVINQACMAASSWRTHLDLSVNVNVSVKQLLDENIMDVIEMALKRHDLPANRLNLEITETVFVSDKHIVLTHIDAIQKLGVKVSIDDFGTGYSSLSMIQNLALDYVKIDKSFVDQIDTNGLSIIKAVVDMSSSLNFLVVAEGVETEQQAVRLSEMGVHFQQGFFHAKPMEYDEVPGFLKYIREQARRDL